MENTTPETTGMQVKPLIETDQSPFMNTIISRATKVIGLHGALHLLCVLNGADVTVMAALGSQLIEANKV